MRILKLIATAAAFAAFLSPAIALADPPPAFPPFGPYTSAQVAALVRLAESQWSGNPCTGKVTVHPMTTAEVLATGKTDVADGFVLGAYADTGSCDVFVVTDHHNGWIDAGVCSLFVHELGHLGGLDHSDDPTSIMAPVFQPTATCEAQAYDVVRAVAPPEAPTVATPTAWPTARIAWASAEHGGRLAMRLSNRQLDEVTIRFYRHGDVEFQDKHLSTVTRRVTRSFEAGVPDVSVRAPRGWEWATLQLTGAGHPPGKAATLRRSSLDNAAPSADDEFGVERDGRPSPALSGCRSRLACR